MTYSIVTYDPDEKAWGVAVASKFLAVGALVCRAQAGAGAVATQALARVGWGPLGLAHMAQGHSVQETLDWLLRDDPNPGVRQIGLVDAHGGAAAYTGSACHEWKGHLIGSGFACQGNILPHRAGNAGGNGRSLHRRIRRAGGSPHRGAAGRGYDWRGCAR